MFTHHVMEMYGVAEVKLRILLTTSLDGDEWSLVALSILPPGTLG